MDVFLGSRMHSTIGAISSGVATIPLSYAYKFEALYSHIDYPYVINARTVTTDEALNMVKQWMNESDNLKEAGKIAVNRALDELIDFKKNLKDSLKNNNLL